MRRKSNSRRVLCVATVLALVESVYAAGCDPRQWQRVVEEVHALLPGVAFTTHLDTPGTGPIGYSAGIAPEHIRSYLAHYHAQNPYSALLARLQEGKVYCSAMLGTRAWIERHPFYHEWLKPAGNFTYGTSVVLARDRRRLMRVSFDIPDRLGHMEAQCARLLERLSPHMTRAFEVNERLGGAAATEAALAGLLDRLDGAALIVGAQARVAALNGEAEALTLMRGYLDAIPMTTAMLKRWVEDTTLVLDRLAALPAGPAARHPGGAARRVGALSPAQGPRWE